MNDVRSNPFSLEDKTILVTGASSGLGRQVAVTCAQRGARLIITGRDISRLQATFDELEGEGHVQVVADLTDATERDRLVEQVGPAIDGLVVSVGKQMLSPIRQLRAEVMTEMFNLHVLAPVMLTQRLLQKNVIAQRCSIIYMLSTSAHIGTRGVGPYSAVKSSLLGIIRCLAIEQAKRGVRVNGISPSAIPTRFWGEGEHFRADLLESQNARHPLGLGTPQDVANGAVYLLSDASRWVTGTSLVMDGGSVI